MERLKALDGEILDGPVDPRTVVVLADSHAIYRVGIGKVLALENDIRVVAQAGAGTPPRCD